MLFNDDLIYCGYIASAIDWWTSTGRWWNESEQAKPKIPENVKILNLGSSIKKFFMNLVFRIVTICRLRFFCPTALFSLTYIGDYFCGQRNNMRCLPYMLTSRWDEDKRAIHVLYCWSVLMERTGTLCSAINDPAMNTCWTTCVQPPVSVGCHMLHTQQFLTLCSPYSNWIKVKFSAPRCRELEVWLHLFIFISFVSPHLPNELASRIYHIRGWIGPKTWFGYWR